MTGPDVRDDPDRTARAITGKADLAVASPKVELRQGVVTAVDVANAKADVTIGGDSTAIPVVAHLSNYRPTVGDTCWVLVNGPDLLVLDRAGALGPSVISNVGFAVVSATESRSSTSYGDLATPGPAVTVSVSPSGRLLVQTSAWMRADNVDGAEDFGGGMAFALSGANARSPNEDDRSMMFSSAAHAHRRTTSTSKITLLVGLTAGSTTVTAKYRNLTASGSGQGMWLNRTVWALPL